MDVSLFYKPKYVTLLTFVLHSFGAENEVLEDVKQGHYKEHLYDSRHLKNSHSRRKRSIGKKAHTSIYIHVAKLP